jgi:group I intron endonuclease
MSKICGIYMIECKTNGKKYIGQSKDVLKRLNEHRWALCKNMHVNTYLQSAWNKYGTENFELGLIHVGNKYNLGKKASEETKKKIGFASSRRKHSEESKRKIGVANKGKKRSEETKQMMRKLKLGKKQSEEHIKNAILARQVAFWSKTVG